MWSVVTPNAGLITEHELFGLLRQRGLRTPEEAAAAGLAAEGAERSDGRESSREASEPVAEALYPQLNAPFRVERAVFERLCRSPAAQQDTEKLTKFVSMVTDTLDLTRAEALQLAALKPRCGLEVHMLVELCHQRLTEREVEDLVELCQELL